ncbi:cytochrome c-type biogenesis protein (plasmid) [Legionella adelaidensis]|uniref:Cytochrome c-type biogenesis protein n=1 Tax=Legionella adelaidensis TaxID=45056 RepID=A0A0W0R4A8_9GAMM|nr:tetratricopeptide repeat protein [Legionella adelaidensis]KTC65904.1 cytochrome c-type biogenesis protein [Legionella adelaidensis]VEH85524.1 cytochrome c-type biogenesis protein [Legionella adelaidensis]
MSKELILIGIFIFLSAIALVLAFYPLRKTKSISILAIFLLAGIVAAYWQWGGFKSWQLYEKELTKKAQVQALLKQIKDPDELITKLQEKLKDNPNSAKGWYLLGRIYASKGEWEQAEKAFKIAYQLKPHQVKYILNLGQSIWQRNHQEFTPASRKLFKKILEIDKNQPDALAMLAMDAFMSHDYEIAINYWQKLLTLAPENSEESRMIRKAIARAELQKHREKKHGGQGLSSN